MMIIPSRTTPMPIINGSPADQAGMVIGAKYKVTGDSCSFTLDSIVTFTGDDNTDMVRFDGDATDGDDWNYEYIENVTPIEDAPEVKDCFISFSGRPSDRPSYSVNGYFTEKQYQAVWEILKNG